MTWWEETKQRAVAWWQRESPSARRAREHEEHVRRLEALPLAVADAAVAKLTGKEPIAELDPASYTDAFVQQYEGWTFGELRILPEPPTKEGRIVGDLDHSLFVPAGQLEVRPPHGAPAPSLAHLALRELRISPRDLEAIEHDVSSWAQDPSEEPLEPEPPPPTPGPEAFELDVRPRAWALVGSAVTLPVGTLLVAFGLFALFRSGGSGLCGAVVALLFGAFVAISSAARLREVIWLEPATRRLRPDPIGFFDPATGKRVEWADVRALEVRWLTADCTLEDGRTVRLARSAFRQPDAFAWALALATKKGAARYR